jgi:hypothetical protein
MLSVCSRAVGPLGGVVTAGVDLGAAPCGGAAPDNELVTLSDVGDQPLSSSAALDDAAHLSRVGADRHGVVSGAVDPGGSRRVELAAAAIAL